MTSEPETPQQRQARIRQQKREAKIRDNAQGRLDKITQISGRTPETMSSAPLVPPVPSQPATETPASQGAVPSANWMATPADDSEQRRLQEEYMKVLLGGSQPNQTGQGQRPGQPGEEDPMIKMMQTMLGGMSGDPNAPSPEGMPFSADDISKMTGMPSFLTSMFMGGKPQTPSDPAQVSRERTWKIVRTVLAVIIGIYTIFTLDRSLSTFGQNPPAPATVQNPFVVFTMGQLLLNGAKVALSGTSGSLGEVRSYIRTGKDIAADGAIPIFMVGAYSWWNRLL